MENSKEKMKENENKKLIRNFLERKKKRKGLTLSNLSLMVLGFLCSRRLSAIIKLFFNGFG